MFRTISKRVPKSADYEDRVWQLDVYKRVLNGTLYDVLSHDFHDDRAPNGDYVPLRNRAPSVRYNLCRLVVDDSVALLFGEGHFPTIDTEDEAIRETIANVVKESALNQVMIDAATRGAIGSVAVLMRVLNGRLFFSALDTLFLTPEWDENAPDELVSVTERRKVLGKTLRKQGYEIKDEDLEHDFWFMRVWDRQADTWYLPWKVGGLGDTGDLVAFARRVYPGLRDKRTGVDWSGYAAPIVEKAVPPAFVREEKPRVDTRNTVQHRLGFVPIVWIRNLPGGDDIDGECTFRGAIETQIEIEYQLSQAGRGLKYSADPLMMLREPAMTGGDMARDAGHAVVVTEKGDAKLLEINGSAAAAVTEYVRTLREFALENMHGNRASPERLHAAQSGRSLELMNQGLIWLADNLRISYGEYGFLRLAKMIVGASNIYALTVNGEAVAPMNAQERLTLKWPDWYPPTAQDKQQQAATLSTLTSAALISRETAVGQIADAYDIEDVQVELAQIAADEEAAMQREIETATQVKANVSEPG